MTTANQASCDTLVLRPGHVSLAELRRLSAGGAGQERHARNGEAGGGDYGAAVQECVGHDDG